MTSQGRVDNRLCLQAFKIVVAIQLLDNVQHDISNRVGLSYAEFRVNGWAVFFEATAYPRPDRTLGECLLLLDFRGNILGHTGVGRDSTIEEAFHIVDTQQ